MSNNIINNKGVSVDLVSIPLDYDGNCESTYFVSGNNGDEYGQYKTLTEALTIYNNIVELSIEERKKHDQ